jgi:hypothetical protein
MRYIYFLKPESRARLVCKEIPYAEIERRGAGMYRGIARGKQAMAEVPSAQRRCSGDRHAPGLHVGFGRVPLPLVTPREAP